MRIRKSAVSCTLGAVLLCQAIALKKPEELPCGQLISTGRQDSGASVRTCFIEVSLFS